MTTVLFHFNVGGQTFTFAKETLEQPHLAGSQFQKVVVKSNKWDLGNQSMYIEADPTFFATWITPYIRDGLLPTAEKLSSYQDRVYVMKIAERVSLLSLSRFVREEMIDRGFHVNLKYTDSDKKTREKTAYINQQMTVKGFLTMPRKRKIDSEKNLVLVNGVVADIENTFGFLGAKPGDLIEIISRK